MLYIAYIGVIFLAKLEASFFAEVPYYASETFTKKSLHSSSCAYSYPVLRIPRLNECWNASTKMRAPKPYIIP